MEQKDKKMRLVLELRPEEHALIKSTAAQKCMSIKKWVLKAIAQELKKVKYE